MNEPLTNDPLPRGWLWTSVGSVGSVRLGRQRSPDKVSGKHPTKYLRLANLSTDGFDLRDVLEMDFSPGERALYLLKPGDILLADSSGSAAHVGRAAIWNDEIPGCCYQNHLIRFRPHAVVPEYALLVFRHYAAAGAFAKVARGVGILHLGASRLASMPFPLPPLSEQKRIAEEATGRMGDLSVAEGSLRSALARTAAQDRVILAAAVTGQLVEPEAARAAREGRPLESADTLLQAQDRTLAEPKLPFFAETAEKPREPTKPELPEGWAFRAVRDVGEVRLGRQRSPQQQRGKYPTPYLRAANITADGLDLNHVLQMDFTPAEREIFALELGDVVLAEASGSPSQVGRPAIWRGEIAGCCFQNTVIRFRSRAALPQYSLLVFRHYAEDGVFARASRGIGLQHLGASRFERLGYPLPPMGEQARIAEEAEARLADSASRRDAVLLSITRIGEMRREVLRAAVTGKLIQPSDSAESAADLLARVGPVPSAEAGPQPTSPAPGKEPTMAKKRLRETTKRAPLLDLLRSAGRPLRLTEAFAMAGYDRDSTADVEAFYLELRSHFGRAIRRVGEDRENPYLEPNDAP